MRSKVGLLLFLCVTAITGTGVSSRAQQTSTIPTIVRLDPRLDKIVPKEARLERVAEGIEWAEGPVWDHAGHYLLFSDVPRNSILKWETTKGLSIFKKPSGYTSSTPFTGREPGSNGLTFDAQGRLVFCQHGDRRISRLEKNGTVTTLADRYEGKRFNSPNDLVFRSNGDLYFTDPPFGLPKAFDDPTKELPFQGVYRLGRDGRVTLLTRELKAPNGIGFSPDESKLYVADSAQAIWFVFEVRSDGTLGPGQIFFDGSELAKDRPGVADSLKVDVHGNIFGAAPGGIWIIGADGKLLGRFELGTPTGNCAWGEDGSTLFIASNHLLYRIRLATQGSGTTVAGFGSHTYAKD